MNIQRAFTGSIPVVWLVMLASCLPAEGAAFSYVYSATGQFGVFNLSSGGYLPIGTIGDVLLADITTAAGHRIYALDSGQNAGLRTIDAATGQTTLIGSTGADLTGLEETSSGAVYAQSGTSFYSVDTTIGVASLIGDFNVPNAFDFVQGAFDSAGHLFAAGLQQGDVETSWYSIDTATGAATLIGSNRAFVQSIVYAGGIFYGFTSDFGTLNAGPVVTIDALTGKATPLLSQDAGLAPVLGAGVYTAGNEVPEAGTLLLFAGGLALVIGWKLVRNPKVCGQ